MILRDIVSDSQFINDRAEMMGFFKDKYFRPEATEMITSPSGKYQLEIQHFSHVEEIRRYNYTIGIIKDYANNVIDSVYRNFPSFLYKWVDSNQSEYLLCGLDYQGYYIVNLSTQEIIHYVPEAAYQGLGFCWADIYYFQDKKLLVIDGCYWAHQYELVFTIFHNRWIYLILNYLGSRWIQ
jgi:hypothetical protein